MTVFLAKSDGKGFDLGSDINRARLKDDLAKNVGKIYRIERPESKRSLSQNSYYWLFLGIIAREHGDDPEALHEHFKQRFAPRKFGKVKGQEVQFHKSTTQMTKSEFGEYLDRIAAECEVPLPNPKEAGFITNY